jgi:hypothetical protein
MTRVQHATTAPISGLDRVPFLGGARVRLERMVLSLTDPPLSTLIISSLPAIPASLVPIPSVGVCSAIR